MAATTRATRPTKLGAKARRVWTGVTESYDLRADELRVLEDACREIDLVERLEAEMRESKLIVHGSQGQPVANPLVQELRQHRATLARLLQSLKLPDEEGGTGADAASTSARDAAAARWKRGA